MKRIYLHAGTLKTGTTSLQQELRADTDRIAAHGIYFPPMMEEYGSRIGGLHNIPAQFRGKALAQGQKGLSDFLEAFENSGLASAFLSSEAFSKLRPEQVAEVAAALRDYDVLPILLFRHPVSFMTALYCSAGAFKRTSGIKKFVRDFSRKWQCQYGSIASAWRDAFPGTAFHRYEHYRNAEEPVLSLMGVPMRENATPRRRVSLPIPLAMLNYQLYSETGLGDGQYRTTVYEKLLLMAESPEYRELSGGGTFVAADEAMQTKILSGLETEMRMLGTLVPWDVGDFLEPLQGEAVPKALVSSARRLFREMHPEAFRAA